MKYTRDTYAIGGLAEAGYVSCERTVGIRWAINDGNRATCDADELVVFVTDLDVPDMSCATTMNGGANGSQPAVAFGAQVIGVDLQPERHLPAHIDVQCGTERGHRFGQDDRDAAMQVANLLAVVGADRHGRDNLLFVSRYECNIKYIRDRPCTYTVDTRQEFFVRNVQTFGSLSLL